MSVGSLARALVVALVALPGRAATPVVDAAPGSAALVPVQVISADAGSATVELSWARSWRDGPGSPRGNHDGVWVFAKARRADERWGHLPLAAVEAGAGYATECTADGRGAFVYRALPGAGDARTRLTLRWAAAGDLRAVRLFAWPVVQVPRGAFDAGDGSATTPGRFHDGADVNRPFRVTAAPIELAARAGALWADDRSWPLPSGAPGPSPWDGRSGPLPAAFPTGHEPFWILRYEITQGQYADFLDLLSPAHAEARAPSQQDFATGGRPRADNYRYTLARTAGHWAADQPRWSMNWLAWEDGIALADWAALRPMTELEFEKAARGPRPAVPGEYAWGTTRITAIRGFEGGDGSGLERALPPEANASWSPGLQDRPLLGPYAAAALADRPAREGRGESFWGVADLSGNVVEMAVSVGLAAGRIFVPRHGDGELAGDGSADVEGWPRTGVRSGPFGAFGYGYRGGDFYNPEADLRVSSRNVANFGGARRLFGLGFRAVRSVEQGRGCPG